MRNARDLAYTAASTTLSAAAAAITAASLPRKLPFPRSQREVGAPPGVSLSHPLGRARPIHTAAALAAHLAHTTGPVNQHRGAHE